MKKIDKTQFSMALLLLMILAIPLVSQFNNFVFHTYETRVYKKVVYSAIDEDMAIDYYSLTGNDEGYQFGSGVIKFKETDFFKENDSVSVVVQVDGKEYVHTLNQVSEREYQMDFIEDPNMNVANELVLEVKNETQNKSRSLRLNGAIPYVLNGQNKDFSIKEMYVYKNRLQLGSINCANVEKWAKDYDKMRVEYRYKSIDENAIHPYVVFHKMTGTLDEILNQYLATPIDIKVIEEGYLQDKEISAVIILQGEEELAFSIDLNRMNGVI